MRQRNSHLFITFAYTAACAAAAAPVCRLASQAEMLQRSSAMSAQSQMPKHLMAKIGAHQKPVFLFLSLPRGNKQTRDPDGNAKSVFLNVGCALPEPSEIQLETAV